MIYAKQVDPKYQTSHFDFSDVELIGFAIYGNNNLKSYMSDEFKYVIDVIDDYWVYYAFETPNVEETIRFFNNEVSFYRNNKPYTNEEIEELRKLIYSGIGYNHIDEIASIVLDEEWKKVTIRGTSQSDCNILYYNSRFTGDGDIERITKDYFNTGNEFMLSDNEDFTNPDYIYCYGDTYDEMKKEIAEHCHCDPSEIKMLAFDGYITTLKFKEV